MGHAQAADVRWIVDPLDGTTNYLHGFPAYAVSIAAEVDSQLAAGVLLDVPHSRLYTAVAGGGAFCDKTRISVSSVDDPRHALLGTGFPFKHPAVERLDEYTAQFSALLPKTAGIRRAGSAAIDLAHVAEGRFDAFWELWLRGVTAGAVVAGNPTMHKWLIEELRNAY